MAIRGVDGLSVADLTAELERGGRFVRFHYCVSLLVVTLRRPSDIFFLRPSEPSPTRQRVLYSVVTLLFGWWGIPWGPIYSVQSLARNARGGEDVTHLLVNTLHLPLYHDGTSWKRRDPALEQLLDRKRTEDAS